MKATAELDSMIHRETETSSRSRRTEVASGLEGRAWVEHIPQTLPIERFGSAIEACKAQTVSVRLSRNLAKVIQKWSDQAGLQPEAYLVAVWQLLIWQLLDRSAHVTGVTLDRLTEPSRAYPLHPRHQWFPVICNPETGILIDEFVRNVQEQIDNQVRQQDRLLPKDDQERAPAAFTVLFGARRLPASQKSGRPARLKSETNIPQDKFLLCCWCELAPSGICIKIGYDAGRIDRRDVSLVARQFTQLCGDAVAAMDTSVAMLTVTDRPQPVRTPPARQGKSQSVPAMFIGEVRRVPDRTAVVALDGRLSYRELFLEAIAIARYLRGRKAGQDVLVGVLAERSIHTVAAIMGVMLAGGAYAPLDPDTPAVYHAKQIAASGIEIILTTQAHDEHSAVDGVPTIFIGDIISKGKSEATAEIETVNPEGLAYVIHTSGSTGSPKAVGVPHHALASYTHGIQERLALAKKRPALSFAVACSLAVDLGHTCVFPALTTGGCLHLVGKTMAMDASDFARYITSNRIDVLKIVPSHFRALLTHGKDVLPRRWLILGGEPFSADLYAQIRAAGGACAVANHYGPTETTVGCLMQRVNAREEVLLPAILYAGRPLPGAECYVLDEAMRPVAVNMPGELFIGGAGLGRGYLRQAAETATRFVPDPFSSGRGRRLYRTGDRARLRRNGQIQIVGRIDDQVKIRGHRVEPAEIEAILTQHPSVAAAAVLVQTDKAGTARLLAFVTAKKGCDSGAREVEAALAAQLPPSMLPSAFVWLDSLPLLPNGKTDRKQLLALASGPPEATKIAGAPQTKVERTITEIWKEVLGCAHIGNEDNFFELGGDSIGAIRVAALMRHAGMQITPIQLFQNPTPRRLADVASPTASVSGHAAGASAMSERYPLTAVQEGILFHCLSSAGERLYVSQAVWTFGPEFDPESFMRAWQCVVDRHSILRTAFDWRDQEDPGQVVQRDLVLSIDRQDWSTCAPGEIEERLERYCADIHRSGIDLDIAPLMRMALIALPDARYYFVFIYNHLLMDGWSEGVLFDELESFYDGFRRGVPCTLPAPAPYHAFVQWLQSKDMTRSDSFWRECLSGFRTPTAVPGESGLAANPEQPAAWECVQIVMDRDSSDALRQLSRRSQITLNTITQAAWALVLGEYGGDTDVMFGSAVAVRPPEVPGIERTIGLFLNMVPVRVRLAHQAGVETWLRNLQDEQARVRQYSDVPLVHVQSCSEIPRGTPLFETTVGFQNLALAPSSYREGRPIRLPIENVAFSGGWTNYAFCIDVEPHEEIQLTASFDKRRFSAGGARQVLEVFAACLPMIAAHAKSTVEAVRGSLTAWRHDQVAQKMEASLHLHLRQFVRSRRSN